MFKDIPTEVVMTVCVIALFVLTLLADKIKALIKKDVPIAVTELKTKLGPVAWSVVCSIAEMAVRAAQQARLNGWIEDTGEAARAYAIQVFKTWCITQGLEELDVDKLVQVIDGIYNTLKDELKKVVEAEVTPATT